MSRILGLISVLLGAAFLAAGASKLAAIPMQVDAFARWGYPPWFLYVTGAIEATY